MMIGLLMEPDLFTVYRATLTGARDAHGRPTESRVAVGTFNGRLEQATTREGEAFVVDRWRAFFPGTADVRAGDEVEARGNRYEVEGTPSVETIVGFRALTNVVAVLHYTGPVAPS